MLKRFFVLSFLVLVGLSVSFAQTSNTQWEYLIVQKVDFADKDSSKITDKWLGIRQTKIGFIQQSLTQNGFDRLGNLGWELVGIDDSQFEWCNQRKILYF